VLFALEHNVTQSKDRKRCSLCASERPKRLAETEGSTHEASRCFLTFKGSELMPSPSPADDILEVFCVLGFRSISPPLEARSTGCKSTKNKKSLMATTAGMQWLSQTMSRGLSDRGNEKAQYLSLHLPTITYSSSTIPLIISSLVATRGCT